MLVKITFLLLLSLSFAHAPAWPQVSPKDGAGRSATDLDRVKVGQPAPDFTLENMDGKPFSLSDYRDKKNVILVFYRGQW